MRKVRSGGDGDDNGEERGGGFNRLNTMVKYK